MIGLTDSNSPLFDLKIKNKLKVLRARIAQHVTSIFPRALQCSLVRNGNFLECLAKCRCKEGASVVGHRKVLKGEWSETFLKLLSRYLANIGFFFPCIY